MENWISDFLKNLKMNNRFVMKGTVIHNQLAQSLISCTVFLKYIILIRMVFHFFATKTPTNKLVKFYELLIVTISESLVLFDRQKQSPRGVL